MKTTVLSIAIILSGIIAFAGNNNNNNTEEAPAIPNLVDFKGAYIQDKLYVNWHVKGEKEKCLYILEKSKDGITYEPEYMKEAPAVEIDAVLMHSFTKDITQQELQDYTFRLKKITLSGSMSISKALEIEYRNVSKVAP